MNSTNSTSADITSGLGIGGHGSDDYNINTAEPHVSPLPPQPRHGFGSGGTRYDEQCERCRYVGEVCNNCGCCRRHCHC